MRGIKSMSSDKVRAIKGLIVCSNWDLILEPLNLINGLALSCYQPAPEVYGLGTLLRKVKS